MGKRSLWAGMREKGVSGHEAYFEGEMGVSGHGVSLMAGMGRGSASRRGEGRGISAESVLQVEGEGRDVRGIWGHGACLGTGIGGQMERSMLQGGDWGGRPRATKRISGRGWENKASRKV